MTTTDIVKRENGAVPREWVSVLGPALELAKHVAGTSFVPSGLRDNAPAIVAAIMYGDELGLGPMQSLAKISVIEGKPTLSAEAQRALILAAGHSLWIDESTMSRVTVSGQRAGEERISSVTWTLDDAKRAGLAGRQNWRTYPRQMLTARATAELARTLFADVIGGLAATEELEDVDPLDLPIDTPLVEPAPTPTKRKRRRTSKALAAAPETPPEAPEPAAAPEPPPLPDEPLAAPDGEDGAPDEPDETEPLAVEDEPAPEPAGSLADESGEVPVEETIDGDSAPVEGVASPDSPTPKQLDALNALVGRLREVDVELPDGSSARALSTEQLWASTARRRNVDVETMIELLNGRDADGVLHWTPLRESLTKSEASDLIGLLEDRSRRWGAE